MKKFQLIVGEMMKRISRVLSAAFLSMISLTQVSCGGDAAEVVQNNLKTEIKIGDDKEKIENFFNKYNIIYSWDGFSKRYQAIIRNPKGDNRFWGGVSIYIYVDRNGNFLNAEVSNFYNFI